jgi:hypothetical protein
MALITHPHLVLRLKKEYSYTSTPPLGLHGLLQGHLYLFLCISLRFHDDISMKPPQTEECTRRFKCSSVLETNCISRHLYCVSASGCSLWHGMTRDSGWSAWSVHRWMTSLPKWSKQRDPMGIKTKHSRLPTPPIASCHRPQPDTDIQSRQAGQWFTLVVLWETVSETLVGKPNMAISLRRFYRISYYLFLLRHFHGSSFQPAVRPSVHIYLWKEA